MGSVRASFEPERSKIGQEMANLPVGGCMTPVCIIRDVWDPLGLHLNQNDLKSGKTWLSYGRFTNGRLGDSSEYHAV